MIFFKVASACMATDVQKPPMKTKDHKLQDMQTCQNRQTWRVCCNWFLHVKSKLRIKFAYLVFIIFGRCRQTSMKRKSQRIRDKVHLIVHSLEVCQREWYQCEVKNLFKNRYFASSDQNRNILSEKFVSWKVSICWRGGLHSIHRWLP